jgi:hypothetical protein
MKVSYTARLPLNWEASITGANNQRAVPAPNTCTKQQSAKQKPNFIGRH